MNPTDETLLSPQDDAQMEALLREFFRREMPSRLHGEAGITPVATIPQLTIPQSANASVTAGTSGTGSVIGLLSVAVVLILVVAVLVGTENPPSNSSSSVTHISPDPVMSDQPVVSVEPETPKAVATVKPPETTVELSVTERVEPIERFTYSTEEGPVEQRTERMVTNVSVYDPESGEQVDVIIQELNIEIFEIDEAPEENP